MWYGSSNQSNIYEIEKKERRVRDFVEKSDLKSKTTKEDVLELIDLLWRLAELA